MSLPAADGPPVVVVGYASLDHAMTLAGFHGEASTSLVTGRLSAPWPSPGGLVHVLRAVSRAAPALPVTAVSWVADDEPGAAWQASVEEVGVGTSGVHVSGTRSPSAYLFYPEEGGTICVYDPGDCHPDGLSSAQSGAVSRAGWCLVTVGPAEATRTVLDVLPADAALVWAAKNDADAFPPDLVAALLARAAVVTFGAGERQFLADALGTDDLPSRCRPGCLLVETRGGDGVRWQTVGAPGEPAREDELAVRRVTGSDTTGAGDTFVGTLVGQLALGTPAGSAFAEATEVASALVGSRTPSGTPSAPDPTPGRTPRPAPKENR